MPEYVTTFTFETVPVTPAPAKLRWTLLPFAAVREVVRVLAFGAHKLDEKPGQAKYLGGDSTRHLDAALRHVAAYCEGERTDKESGLPTLAHAAARLLLKLACDLTYRDFSDASTRCADSR